MHQGLTPGCSGGVVYLADLEEHNLPKTHVISISHMVTLKTIQCAESFAELV